MVRPKASNLPPSGPSDRITLRDIERSLSQLPLATDVEICPNPHEPQYVLASLRPREGSETPIQMEIYWWTSGMFSIKCRGTDEQGNPWKCRWDNHTNPQVTSRHFHHPPDCNPTESVRFGSVVPSNIVIGIITAILD